MSEVKAGLTEALSVYKHNLQLRIAAHKIQNQPNPVINPLDAQGSNRVIPPILASPARKQSVPTLVATPVTTCSTPAISPLFLPQMSKSPLLQEKSNWLREILVHSSLGKNLITRLLSKNGFKPDQIYASIKAIFTTPSLSTLDTCQYKDLRSMQKNLLCFIDQNEIPLTSDYKFTNTFSLFFLSGLPKEEIRSLLEDTIMPLFEELFLEEPASDRRNLIKQMAHRIQAKFTPYLEETATVINRKTITHDLLEKILPSLPSEMVFIRHSSYYSFCEEALEGLYLRPQMARLIRSPQSPAEKTRTLLGIKAKEAESKKERQRESFCSPSPSKHPVTIVIPPVLKVVTRKQYSEETIMGLRRAFSQAEPLINLLRNPGLEINSPAEKIESWLRELNRYAKTTETYSPEFRDALKQVHLILSNMAEKQKNRQLIELANKHSNFFMTLSA